MEAGRLSKNEGALRTDAAQEGSPALGKRTARSQTLAEAPNERLRPPTIPGGITTNVTADLIRSNASPRTLGMRK